MKHFNKFFISVFLEDGYHKAMIPTGEVIPCAVKSIVVDEVGFSTATFDFPCNVVSTKENAIEKYEESGIKIKARWKEINDEKPTSEGVFRCYGTLWKGSGNESRCGFNAFWNGCSFVDKNGEDLIGINDAVEYWFDFNEINNPR